MVNVLGAAAQSESTRIQSIGRVPAGVEIEVNSTRPFPVRALRPVLKVGGREFLISRYPDDGRHDTIFFLLSESEFSDLPDGAEVVIQYDRGAVTHPRSHWQAGELDKTLLERGQRGGAGTP
jgi:hypothetical protein